MCATVGTRAPTGASMQSRLGRAIRAVECFPRFAREIGANPRDVCGVQYVIESPHAQRRKPPAQHNVLEEAIDAWAGRCAGPAELQRQTRGSANRYVKYRRPPRAISTSEPCCVGGRAKDRSARAVPPDGQPLSGLIPIRRPDRAAVPGSCSAPLPPRARSSRHRGHRP
jgi:hypothetical protein